MVDFKKWDNMVAAAIETEEGRAFTAAGFKLEHMGGGCTAWRKEIADGKWILITDSEGVDHTLSDTSANDPAKPDFWIVGVHSEDADLDYKEAATAPQAVWAALALEYTATIGYDPFEDDPTISPETVAQTLREYADAAKEESGVPYAFNAGINSAGQPAIAPVIDIHLKIKLAREFGTGIQGALSRAEFQAAVDRNKAEPADSNVCHTHDFCDANMVMNEAFQAVMGRGPAFIESTEGAAAEADTRLWADAWAIAKAADFFA